MVLKTISSGQIWSPLDYFVEYCETIILVCLLFVCLFCTFFIFFLTPFVWCAGVILLVDFPFFITLHLLLTNSGM